MAGETITQLPPGAALTGPEVAAFVQSGVTVQITANQISSFVGLAAGTITNISAVNTNGFAWSITNPTSTPALTLSTSINGFLQGNGTAISAASVVGSGASLVTATSVTGSGTAAVFATSPTVSGLTVTGSFTATGLVTNADLAFSTMTIAGHSVSLGGTQAIAAADLSNGVTGSGAVVLAGSPTLVTPVIGTATGTSLTLGTVSSATGTLKLANASSANLVTIQAGNNVAARTYTWPTDFGAAGTVLTDAAGNGTLSWSAGGGTGSGTVTSVSVVSANGFGGSVATATSTPAITITTSVNGILSGNGTAVSAASTTGSGSVVLATTPTLVTPVLGVATGTSIALGGATLGANALAVTGTVLLNSATTLGAALTYGSVTLSNSVTGTGSMVLSAGPTITGHPTIEGVTSTGATGTGAFVFATSPTLVTPVIGVATGTSLQLGVVSTTTGSLKLANSSSANLTTIQAGNASAARTYSWPVDFGAAGTVLTDAAGNGVLSWTAGGGTGVGTVTSVSVVSANGFAGTVATATSTPAITLTTSITGILQGNGTAISAAATTGSGSVVLATNPTIPVINKVTITAPATGATLTIADGTTLTTTANATISGTNTGDQTITLAGDVTGSGTGTFTTTIANNAVSNAKLRQSVGLSVIGNASTATANVADITGTAGQVLTVNAAGTALIFGSLQPGGGGTGLTSMTAHAVPVGNGTSSMIMVGPGAIGTLFTGQGSVADPLFTATPVLGINGTTYGTLSFANGGVGGAFATIQNRGATAAYNFNLPTTAGTAGQVLTSAGGGSSPMTWGAGGISAPGTTVKGGYPTWSTTLGTVLDGQGRLNALGYGALNDGSNATTTRVAIQAALNTGNKVYLPEGTYTVDVPLTISANGAGLIGDGIDGTTLQGNFASGDIIQILDGVFFNEIGNMRVTRTSLGTSGSGINVVGSSTGNDGAYLHDLDVYNHNIGVTLGRVTQGHFYNSIVTANRSHNVFLNGNILQWSIFDVLASGSTTGDGFRVTGTGSPTPCGQWRGLTTASNAGFSFKVTNADGLRVSDSFFGAGALGEVIVQTATSTDVPHHFTNVYCEANKDVNAWQFDSSCITEVHLDNCTGTTGGAGNGIVSAAPLTMITNGAFIAKAGFGASTASGIVITGARGSVVGSSALGFGGTGNIVASGITAVSIHACRANGLIVTAGTGTVSTPGNY